MSLPAKPWVIDETYTIGGVEMVYTAYGFRRRPALLEETDPVFVAWRDASRSRYNVFAAPNNANGAPSWRRLTYSDIDNPPSIPSPATSNPLAHGTAAVGTSLLYARQDHVHPSDNTNTITQIRRTDSAGGGATTYRTGNISLREGTNVTITEVSTGVFQFAATGTGASYTFVASIDETAGAVQLVNDESTPAAKRFYSTDGDGARGWHPLPLATTTEKGAIQIGFTATGSSIPLLMTIPAGVGYVQLTQASVQNAITDHLTLPKSLNLTDVEEAISGPVIANFPSALVIDADKRVKKVTAGAIDEVLVRQGTDVYFGLVQTGSLASRSVTAAKLVEISANSILGRLSGNGDMQQLTGAEATSILDVYTKAQAYAKEKVDWQTSTTWNWATSLNLYLTPSSATTISVSNTTDGETGIIVLEPTGSNTLTFPSGWFPSTSTGFTNNHVHIITVVRRGSNYYWTATDLGAKPT